MKTESAKTALDLALTGQYSHPNPLAVLEGLPPEAAGKRPGSAPHSIHELLFHIVFWQDLTLDWIEGKDPDLPDPATGWPATREPESPEAWEALVGRFKDGLAACREAIETTDLEAPLTAPPDGNPLKCLTVAATHNSFHLGQIVLLRRQLGVWP